MASIVVAGDTSGTVTLAAPAVSGTTTLTLPTTSGTLVTTASGQTLNSPTIATPTITGQATIPTINLTGGQITFPATQNPSTDANTLDDYEEGTWTPTLVGSTSGSATIGSIAARYVKIGRQVTIWAELQGINKNTLSGIARLSLPFTSSSSAGYPTGVMRYTGLTNMSTSTVVDPIVSPATNYIFFQSKNATSYIVADLTNSNFNTTFDLYMVTVTYEAA
jgi:hypothetical protein